MRIVYALVLLSVLSALAAAEVVEEEKDPAAIFGKFTLWSLVAAYAIYHLGKKSYSKRAYIVSMLLSLLIAGFLLGSEPSSVGVIQDTVLMLANNTIFPPRFVGLAVFLGFIAVAGRIFCGVCCPFGILQELSSRLGLNKVKLPNKAADAVRAAVFVTMVAVTLILSTSFFEPVNPFSVFKREVLTMQFDHVEMTAVASGIFSIILSVFVYRPFCRLACPYGFLANLGSKKARYVLSRDDRCIECKKCENVCPTGQAGRGHPHTECYYCRKCIEVCPTQAIVLKK